ncbi:hypothetical protein H0264_19865 [Nocardia huaxiensis]|uniref:Polysaccharide chain length determinant N-terminal domain-containing protein n=1 Tax=Nocardia huaxiensis TaxID=2755382 RepID=A0A7D6ZKD0_9NOCA|nr:hypothetical protein [Nocardia huaxiensis]QLY27725.1 hypothetical protein H0264_19865 [Nocardia huaxiensis]
MSSDFTDNREPKGCRSAQLGGGPLTTNTFQVLIDRIWRRRLLVAVIGVAVFAGAYLSVSGQATTYTSRVLVSAGSTSRPPTEDAILAQGYTYYLNDPTYQSNLKQSREFPTGVSNFSATFVVASPLFYIQVVADTPEAAKAAAPKIAQLYADDINGRLDANRAATAAEMTSAMRAAWNDRLNAQDPNAFTAQIQLQQAIDELNADGSNRLTIMQAGAGATANGTGSKRTLATGLVGGLVLGCVVALMAGAATRRLYTDYDVVEKTGVKTFDVIPPGGTPARDGKRQVALRHVANLIAKSSTGSPTSLAVAPVSSGPSGDSLARGIAEQRAAQGARTVFVNADLRSGWPTAPAPGVAEFLRGAIRDMRALRSARGPDGFSEIAPGAAGADPYGLFDRDRVRALLAAAGQDADLVVIGLPPMSTAPEAQIVADLADLTVLVIERGVTTSDQVHEAVKAINQVGAEVLGAVLVDTSNRRGWLRLPHRSRPEPVVHDPLATARITP